MFIESDAGPPGIDRDMDMIFAALEELNSLASDEQQAQDDARIYDFSIRWGVLLSGRLLRLEHYHRAEELSRDQKRRYRELEGELGEAAPLAERLGIAQPNVGPRD
jgi:hypothetical protein